MEKERKSLSRIIKYYQKRARFYDYEPSRRHWEKSPFLLALERDLQEVIDSIFRVQSTNEVLRFLDIGCGSGFISLKIIHVINRIMNEYCRNCYLHYVGIDATRDMLDIFRSRVAGSRIRQYIDLIEADAHRTPLACSSVDAVAAIRVLQYLDLSDFFKEVKRILKERGILYIYVQTLHELDKQGLRNKIGIVHGKPYLAYFYSKHEILSSSESFGFKLLKSCTIEIFRSFKDLAREKSRYFGRNVVRNIIKNFKESPPIFKKLYGVTDKGFLQYYTSFIFEKRSI